MRLEEARLAIDDLNAKLVELMEFRLSLVNEIAKYKESEGLPIYDPKREAEIIENVLPLVKMEENKEYIKDFMHEVMRISRDYQKSKLKQFVYLIGMPAAGKTTIGKALADELQLAFYDVDQLIQEKTNRTLQNIIINDGEPAFRELEYEIINSIIADKPGIIATGGGTVLSDKTVKLMRDTGVVVFVHRDVKEILDDLDLEIRPLLKESIEYIFRLYEERCPIYENVSDIKIKNTTSITDAVDKIIGELPKEFRK